MDDPKKERDDNKPLRFEAVVPQTRQVFIGPQEYELREPMEEDACAYHNAITSGAQMEGRRVTKMGSVASAEPILVAACLFEVDGAGRKRVPLKEVYGWPSRIVKPMFEWLQKVGDLKGEEEDEGENPTEE